MCPYHWYVLYIQECICNIFLVSRQNVLSIFHVSIFQSPMGLPWKQITAGVFEHPGRQECACETPRRENLRVCASHEEVRGVRGENRGGGDLGAGAVETSWAMDVQFRDLRGRDHSGASDAETVSLARQLAEEIEAAR